MATIGEKCPLFELKNQRGENINIENLIGEKNLIIYFYPKDDTPGCTKEACSFRDNYEEFKDLGCEVIGISADSVEAHKKFANKHRLSFTLLSDSDKAVRKAFKVPTNMLGLLDGRVTYIIDKKGIIQGIFNSQLNPVGHIDAALKTVKSLNN
jgi:peroxiredoxin Q/BCP